MGESKDYGSITRGKVANFFITKPLPSLAYVPYAHQTPIIKRVVLKGQLIK
jgi:imidazolonepropionase